MSALDFRVIADGLSIGVGSEFSLFIDGEEMDLRRNEVEGSDGWVLGFRGGCVALPDEVYLELVAKELVPFKL